MGRLTKKSVGEFSPESWIQEGDGLLASAKTVRSAWREHKTEFNEKVSKQKGGGHPAAEDWIKLTGLPRASALLLGYSAEMYLKGGLATVYQGCSEEMFSDDVRNEFGHDLVKLAHEVGFFCEKDDESNLKYLQDMVVFDARYPVSVGDDETYSDAVNRQTRRVWDEKKFDDLAMLIARLREHADRVSGTTDDPVSNGFWKVDDDGYLAYRSGGGVVPRVTYRISSAMRENGEVSLDAIRAVFRDKKFLQLNSLWDRALIVEDRPDKRRKTVVIRSSSK